MASVDESNPRIGRNAHSLLETFTRRVMCLNGANAARDDAMMPLADRIPLIAERINASPKPIDVLFFLEAGRGSRDKSWTEMAAELERLTDLEYLGVFRLNATQNPFGKAVFFRRSTMACLIESQEWLSPTGQPWDGDYFGIDCLYVKMHPVVTDENVTIGGRQENLTRVIRNRFCTASIFHFPMTLPSRISSAEWVRDNARGDILMGDFNTFPDDGGPQMLDIITSQFARHDFPDVPYTFRAFAHDVIRKPAEFREQLNEHSTVERTHEDGSIDVRFASTLDHLFYDKHSVEGSFVLPMHGASDHDAIVAEIIF